MTDYIDRQTVLRCIKESRENIDWGQSEDGDAFLHYSAALYRTIASKECLPSAWQWIPVMEALPDTEDYVLCTTEKKNGDRSVVRGYYTGSSWVCGMNSNVVAWMPLPEPYKEGQIHGDVVAKKGV